MSSDPDFDAQPPESPQPIEPSDSIEPAVPRKRSPIMIIAVVLGLLVLGLLLSGGILTALLMPAVTTTRSASRQAESANNLKQIGLALLNYHEAYEAFPPAYTTDEDGQPLLSWRVLILPFMQQSILHEQFVLEEPWDSPNNRSLLQYMPPVFGSPRYDQPENSNETNYVTIRSEDSVFPGDRSIRIRDVIDGTTLTVAVVEMKETGIPWTRPDDVTPQQAYAAIAGSKGSTEGTNILLSDGSVRQVDGQLTQSEFEAMVTRRGGETIAADTPQPAE
ncbi:DUF1559 family PulG-like putative transporter [Candidatus Laterigemmans baculatus]|uniref:DUF1559 family PulG-like putative transporter n=1 Tax=Candidatus Laterigemmans baculatus TaxID=2770505 RepID=UPI0013D98E72|nr:DUF1559 domain-containing protein [Candidatus Laterigemmans baculatus]